MISKVKVSVCMITYNHELFIRDAIEGVLMQKINVPLELFIGEDFSSDNTQIICQEYTKRYPDIIRLLSSSKNLGVMANFTRTLRECDGKYISLCEGDDYWIDPYKLQKQIDFLEHNADYVLSVHNVIAINVIDDKRTRSEIVQEFLEKEPEDIPIGHSSHTSSMLFRNVIRNFPGDFDKIISGDSYLQFVLARYGKSIFQKNIYPNVRRRHPESIWSYKSQEYKVKQGIYLYEKLLEIAINTNEVKYLNKILIKHRIRYVKFLLTNRRKRESVDVLKRTVKEAWANKLSIYLLAYIITTLPLISAVYKFFKNKTGTRLK